MLAAAVAVAIGPDGKGLPPGKGNCAAGKAVYENACCVCHGRDLKGVAEAERHARGRCLAPRRRPRNAHHQGPGDDGRELLGLCHNPFHYIRRAMPFTSPGSLTTDEYILAEANVIDKVTVLDARTLPAVQMPKREGFVPDPRPELFK
jgi:hypothetical protein